MRFNQKQVETIADWILSAGLERVECCLPPTLPLDYFCQHRANLEAAIGAATDTAAMMMATLVAKHDSDGCGTWDWTGADEYRKLVDNFVAARTDPSWPGFQPGELTQPDTGELAKLFCADWDEFQAEINPTPAPCAACKAIVATLAGGVEDSGIVCTDCGKLFCDNCYDCSKGDGCHCHPAGDLAATISAASLLSEARTLANGNPELYVQALVDLCAAATGLPRDETATLLN